eukprot:13210219-Alexandrium_andersonii.AAC.1
MVTYGPAPVLARGDLGGGPLGVLGPARPSRLLRSAELDPRCRARSAWPGWPGGHAVQSPTPRS